MNASNSIYLPPRLYERMKSIYSEGVTVLCAPHGCGKSTALLKFMRCSRHRFDSRRFIKKAENADDCFGKICYNIFGEVFPIPIDEDSFCEIRDRLTSAPSKHIVVAIDCDAGVDAVLGSLRSAELLSKYSNASIVLCADSLSDTQRKTAAELGMNMISEDELKFTEGEIRSLFELHGARNADFPHIYFLTNGNALSVRLCLCLCENGFEIPDTDADGLLRELLDKAFSPAEIGALAAAVSFDYLDGDYCSSLGRDRTLSDYFGEQAFDFGFVCDTVEKLSGMLRIIFLNRKTHRVRAHFSLKRFIRQYVNFIPNDCHNAMRRCFAKHAQEIGDGYSAFCEYVMAGDIGLAARVSYGGKVSFDTAFRERNVLLHFIRLRPFECREIMPKYLQIASLFVATPYGDEVRSYYRQAISFIIHSERYIKSGRRTILSYAYALLAGAESCQSERMGTLIRQAHDLRDDSSLRYMPFYSWNKYAISLFGIMHSYSNPTQIERNQIMQNQQMYDDITGRDSFVPDVYDAESDYCSGQIDIAEEKANAILEKCVGEENVTSRLNTLLLLAKIYLYKSSCRLYEQTEGEIKDIMLRSGDPEVQCMARLCLAWLSCIRADVKYDTYYLRLVDDERIMFNSYTAPFYYLALCMSKLIVGEYSEIVDNIDKYLEAADRTHGETVRHQLSIICAQALFRLGRSEEAKKYINAVLPKLVRGGVYIPVAEVLSACHDAMLYLKSGEHDGDVVVRVCEAAAVIRSSADVVRMYLLNKDGDLIVGIDPPDNAISKAVKENKALIKELKLNEKSFTVAALAAGGLSNEDIAKETGYTVDSIKGILKRIYAKLGITSRDSLSRFVPPIDIYSCE